jgi:hypothetical protein
MSAEFKAHVIPTLVLSLALCWISAGAGMAQSRNPGEIRAADTLVLVNFVSETRGNQEVSFFDGRRLQVYRPKVINVFPSAGVVLDDTPHILTFLGYRWVDIQTPEEPRIEIITRSGEHHRGKMVGIDQSLGVAVLASEGEATLQRTPTCMDCEVKPSSTVWYPIFDGMRLEQFESAQILSVGTGRSGGGWTITYSSAGAGSGQPRLDHARNVLGLPLLNEEHQFLGFLANQQPSAADPMGLRRTLYRMPQLMTSVEKILKAGGHVQTGWLGIYIDESPSEGVRIHNLDESGPAHKAGLLPGDTLLTYAGREISDNWQFIRMVQDTAIGSEVAIHFDRDGRPMTRVAIIEARKPRRVREKLVFGLPPSTPQHQPVSIYGLECVPLTPQLADFLQQPFRNGLLIANVDESKAFFEAGLRAGDLILSVDRQKFSDPASLFAYIQSQRSGSLAVRFLRKGIERRAEVRIP